MGDRLRTPYKETGRGVFFEMGWRKYVLISVNA